MVFLAWLVPRVVLPDSANTKVVMCSEDGTFGQELIVRLKEADRLFVFEEVEDEETLRRQILSGEAESGLVIKEGCWEKLCRGDTEDVFRLYCSGTDGKQSLLRETVCREFFRSYSVILLETLGEDFFEEENRQEAVSYMLERNDWYQSGNDVFDVDYEEIETVEIKGEAKDNVLPLRGIVATIIFLGMLLEKGAELSGQDRQYADNLPRRDKRAYLFWHFLSVSFLPGLAGILLCYGMGEGTHLLLELGKMLAFLLFSGVWVYVLGRLFSREYIFHGWICPLLVVNLLLPPVFFNLSRYVPTLDYINWILPVGFYLKLFCVWFVIA